MGTILQHHQKYINWLKDLKRLSDDQWRTPIASGKWSPSEIIAHLILWDRYVFEERLPSMLEGGELPKGVDVESINGRATEFAKTHSKEPLIEELARERKKLIELMLRDDGEALTRTFSIRGNQLTLRDYLEGLAEHDLHHQKQIDAFVR